MKSLKPIYLVTAAFMIFSATVIAQQRGDAVVQASDNAAYISQSMPGEMTTGQTYGVSVTMKNTGSNTWKTGSHSLKLISSTDAQSLLKTWGISSVAVNSSVNPGDMVVFNFTLTAPGAEGNYNLQWQMADGAAYFGEPTMVIPVRVAGTPVDPKLEQVSNAVFTAQKIPTRMDAGNTYDASISAKNTGSSTWKLGEFKLKIYISSTDGSNNSWVVPDVDIPYDVVPGSEAVISFKLPAAMESGTYNFQSQLARNNNVFGDKSTNIVINVN
jgi:hypothetical protein